MRDYIGKACTVESVDNEDAARLESENLVTGVRIGKSSDTCEACIATESWFRKEPSACGEVVDCRLQW